MNFARFQNGVEHQNGSGSARPKRPSSVAQSTDRRSEADKIVDEGWEYFEKNPPGNSLGIEKPSLG